MLINESRVAGTIFSVLGNLNVRGHLRTKLCHYLCHYLWCFRLTFASGNKPVLVYNQMGFSCKAVLVQLYMLKKISQYYILCETK